jgi:hypothetical protein
MSTPRPENQDPRTVDNRPPLTPDQPMPGGCLLTWVLLLVVLAAALLEVLQ